MVTFRNSKRKKARSKTQEPSFDFIEIKATKHTFAHDSMMSMASLKATLAQDITRSGPTKSPPNPSISRTTEWSPGEATQVDQLTEEQQDDMRRGEHCWTCTCPGEASDDHLPLSLGEVPIVIPVRNQYPLMPLSSPPPPGPASSRRVAHRGHCRGDGPGNIRSIHGSDWILCSHQRRPASHCAGRLRLRGRAVDAALRVRWPQGQLYPAIFVSHGRL